MAMRDNAVTIDPAVAGTLELKPIPDEAVANNPQR